MSQNESQKPIAKRSHTHNNRPRPHIVVVVVAVVMWFLRNVVKSIGTKLSTFAAFTQRSLFRPADWMIVNLRPSTPQMVRRTLTSRRFRTNIPCDCCTMFFFFFLPYKEINLKNSGIVPARTTSRNSHSIFVATVYTALVLDEIRPKHYPTEIRSPDTRCNHCLECTRASFIFN